MTVSRAQEGSLRLTRFDSTRLVWALVISLALHGGGWGAYEVGKKYHVWEHLNLPAWVKALIPPLFKSRPAENKPPVADREPPLMFVNVTPQQATTEAPKDAKYYSSNNSKAANPDTDRDTDTPKINGKQDVVPKTEDVDRNKIPTLRPALPAEKPQPEERAVSKPKTAPGDLTMAKPELNPRPDTGNAEKPRPRTLNEAAAQRPLDRIPGHKMKQDGGVKYRVENASLDAKATPFGAYDALLVEYISQRWWDILATRNYASDARGYVTVQFTLHYDGKVTDIKTVENTVTDMLAIICRMAIEQPAPYDKWPTEMRQLNNGDVRTVKFRFYYN